MIESAVKALVALLQALGPELATAGSPTVQAVIDALLAWFPLIVAEYQALAPIIKNVLLTLEGNPATTAEQIAVIKIMSAQLDADFDDAMAKAEAEDAPDAGNPSP